MRKPDKFLLFFILLIGLGFSICMTALFYPVPIIQDFLNANIEEYAWLSYVFAGYGVIMCLFFLLLLLIILFLPVKSNFLILKKNRGEIQFSKRAIESTVRYSFMDLGGIDFSRIRIKLNRSPEKIKIYVKLSVSDMSNLAHLTETVQEKIASMLKASLGITVNRITIRVTESNTKHELEKEEDVSEDSRII